MKFKLIGLILLMANATQLFANEGPEIEKHTSIWDLKYSILNFAILVGFIIWKGKKPLSDMFTKMSQDVADKMQSAEKQSKDAKEKLEKIEKSLKNIDSELSKIESDYQADLANFTANEETETAATIARMKRDFENKLEGEKKEYLINLNNEIVNGVVNDTKKAISSNELLKKKATDNLIMGIK